MLTRVVLNCNNEVTYNTAVLALHQLLQDKSSLAAIYNTLEETKYSNADRKNGITGWNATVAVADNTIVHDY